MHCGAKFIEEPGKLGTDLNELRGLPKSGDTPHVSGQLTQRPGHDALVGKVVGVYAAPDRADHAVQTGRLAPVGFFVGLSGNARYVHPKGASYRTDQCRARRRGAGLYLGQKAVGDVRPVGQLTARPAPGLADDCDPGTGPVLISHVIPHS